LPKTILTVFLDTVYGRAYRFMLSV